ncbi:hypothetical protein ACFSTC_20995 [Nonomuraea ferruginea]
MTISIKTVLHPVTDLAKAKAVYAALLGVEPQTDSSYYVGFEAGGQHIGLVPGGGPQGMTSPVAYWHVPDIEAKVAEMTAAGGHRAGGRARGRRQPPGGHRHRPRRQRPRTDPGPMSPLIDHDPDSPKGTAMTSFASVTLEVPDPAAADAFYRAFGLDPYVHVRASDAPADRLPRLRAVTRGGPAG